ncbi:MAG: sel1 repeat family protein [Rhodospirillales bacterium]|nr:sel1 repeat family protein [Rhodospirillales bacterium]
MLKIIKGILISFALLMGTAALALADFADVQAAAKRGDYPAAIAELAKLSEQGDRRSQFMLALVYRVGKWTEQDYAKAAKYLRLAAGKGQMNAQYVLADQYRFGQGVEQNAVMAHAWAAVAASQGSKAGGAIRASVEKNMTPAQIAEARKKALELRAGYRWPTIVADQGLSDYIVSCGQLKFEIEEAESFATAVKTEDDLKNINRMKAASSWSSIALLYPDLRKALGKIDRRRRVLGELWEYKKCS